MASRGKHLAQARTNRAFAELLLQAHPNDPTAMQWAVTAAFYCAVHCIEAHLASFGVASRSHTERDFHIADPRYGVPSDVADAYEQLKRRSRGARYYMWQFTAANVRREVLDRHLAKVTAFVGL